MAAIEVTGRVGGQLVPEGDICITAMHRDRLETLVSTRLRQSGRVSVLSPIGMALLGSRAGDTVAWRIPSGPRRLRIERVLYQPEAAGSFQL